MQKKTLEALEVARELIKDAEVSISEKRMDVAETLYRKSLVKIREALLWEPEEKSHRKYLHEVGRLIHDTFGCQFEFIEETYRATCPVLLSHIPYGISIGGSAKSICSICGKDTFDCTHVKGRIYDNVVTKHFQDICNICGQQECEHKEGEIYNEVKAFSIVVELDLDHIALVENPANPMCCIDACSVPKSEFIEKLPEDKRDLVLHREIFVECHHCLICQGI